ncbi:MAG: arsenate reductase ArsC [Acidobacteriota bacterium]|nr:MAG: arsenate reductase ArsC [Acidobacteriota bacterium]
MPERCCTVLFLCTGNSARSLMAECALNRLGKGRFQAFSAGSHPMPAPHPMTLEVLQSLGYDTSGLRSKSWEEFSRADSPELDFVLTVCDKARGEACPVWPGTPITAHWGVEDPAAIVGPRYEQQRMFRRIYSELEHRVRLLTSFRPQTLDRLALQRRVEQIGRLSGTDTVSS